MQIKFASSASSSGQMLPMLSSIIALIFILSSAVTHFLLRTHRQLIRDQDDFQTLFTQHLKTAYTLNAICENNHRLAAILDELIPLFTSGSGYALDLAASVSVWEQHLPRPLLNSAFADFQKSASLHRREFNQLIQSNFALMNSISHHLRTQLVPLSLRESICAFAEGKFPSSLKGSSLGCALTAKNSLFAQPELRKIRDLKLFLDSLGVDNGFIHISFSQDVVVRNAIHENSRSEQGNPFEALKIELTHGSFCPRRVATHMRQHCPKATGTTGIRTHLVTNERASFETHWSVAARNE